MGPGPLAPTALILPLPGAGPATFKDLLTAAVVGFWHLPPCAPALWKARGGHQVQVWAKQHRVKSSGQPWGGGGGVDSAESRPSWRS